MKLTSNIVARTQKQCKELDQLRSYLASLEIVARHGRLAEDPKETIAAAWTFARPSVVLARLAEKDRRCNQ